MIHKSGSPPIIRVKIPRKARRFEMVVGLEVHVRLATATKLFCSCPNEFVSEPNVNICPVCVGMPGALPVINERAVDLAIRAALALNMRVNSSSEFARKSYFYPDLPKGFQISQYDRPVASNGRIEISTHGIISRIGITRAHLEEDAGKLVHIGSRGIVGATGALVDCNRAGTPLLEIVSEPELRSADEAVEYLRTLRELLIVMGITDGNMEKGSVRCDANISMRPVGSLALGTKVEVKNLNSFRFLKMALEAESTRQSSLLSRGESVRQETRTFDPESGLTSSLRSKEESNDYRYFPEPDLLPLEIASEKIERIRIEMPLSPSQKREHYGALGLSREVITILLGDSALAHFFDMCIQPDSIPPATFAIWLANVFTGELRRSKQLLPSLRIRPEDVVTIFHLIENNTISSFSGVVLLRKYFLEGGDPSHIAIQEGMTVIHNETVLLESIGKVLERHPSAIADYKSGKRGVRGFLIGQVRIVLGGSGDIRSIEREIDRLLDEDIPTN